MRLSEIVPAAGVEVHRDGEFRNLGFLGDHQAGMLVFLEESRFLTSLRQNQGVGAVLTTPDLAGQIPGHLAMGVCTQPRLTFARIHNHLAGAGFYWDDFVTVIDPDAEVHPSAWVAEKNVLIGRNSRVGPHVSILERCVIEEEVVIGAGAVLGGWGFQTVRTHRPMLEMQHAGGLTIHDCVQILPGAVIATGLFRRNTEIHEEVRVGSQAFISHAVQVGARAFIGHGAVVNGNVAIGEEAWIGPGAVISNNLEIGERAFVTLGAVVIRNVSPGSRVSGDFARSHEKALRRMAAGSGNGAK
jgi:UDP-3-O-[3-hydroxymyristoyl] glucosamine N-acyltransferase